MTTPIGIVGPRGRMGAALMQLVSVEPDLLAVPVVRLAGEAGRTIDQLGAADCWVLIDFSHRDSVQRHAAWVARHGIAWVLGTTGLDADDQAAVQAASQRTLVFQASNFSLGVALLTELAERAARVLGVQADVEIAEVHHRHKKDAPSGTALSLGRAIAAMAGLQRGGATPRAGIQTRAAQRATANLARCWRRTASAWHVSSPPGGARRPAHGRSFSTSVRTPVDDAAQRPGVSWISNSLGQSLPVTNSRLRAAGPSPIMMSIW